jgi:tetratricopeptide (TPR) repeat protein
MSRGDWFRNVTWNEQVAARFEEKLRRSRSKNQHLRIQALKLVDSHPQVTLQLLDRYFALGENVDHALAYEVRAQAYLVLDRAEDAVAAYEAALEREIQRPTVVTQASVDFPYLVAVRGLVPHYRRALEVLASRSDAPPFPISRFKWHAARALILAASGEVEEAKVEAQRALEAASEQRSEFQYHRQLGLVGSAHADVISRLRRYCDA